MHELAITCSIADLVTQAAQGRKVRRINIEIGKLSGVMPDAVAFCFPEVVRGTLLEDANLAISEIVGRVRCQACGTEFQTADLLTICGCGSLQVERLAGEELNIKSIELDEAP
jgi:hydrogenase nickel incorporation protein HypA/HybF